MLEISRVGYYRSGNPFTGSHGPLRYRIEPEEDTLHVYTWTQDLCFDLADHGEAQDFPLSEEGLEQIRSSSTTKAGHCEEADYAGY